MTSPWKLAGIAVALAAAAYLAICALLYLSQDSFIYYPTGRIVDTPRATLSRGGVEVVVSTRPAPGRHAVVYFGGNAEDVSRAVAPLGRAFPDAAVYAMHYRGYGGSGGEPSEQALVADGAALLRRVAQSHACITLVGRSLGSALAVQAAASGPVQRLVLVTPFNSIAELAADRFRLFPTRLLLRDRYESWRHARALEVPTTIIVAGDDRVVPRWSSLKLADAFPPGVARVRLMDGTGHNTVSDAPGYGAALAGPQAGCPAPEAAG